MFEQLTELARYIGALPAGRVIDDALRADLVRRITSIGRAAPQASGGSRWDELEESILSRYPAPAGPGDPPPGPAPPFKPPPAGED